MVFESAVGSSAFEVHARSVALAHTDASAYWSSSSPLDCDDSARTSRSHVMRQVLLTESLSRVSTSEQWEIIGRSHSALDSADNTCAQQQPATAKPASSPMAMGGSGYEAMALRYPVLMRNKQCRPVLPAARRAALSCSAAPSVASRRGRRGGAGRGAIRRSRVARPGLICSRAYSLLSALKFETFFFFS